MESDNESAEADDEENDPVRSANSSSYAKYPRLTPFYNYVFDLQDHRRTQIRRKNKLLPAPKSIFYFLFLEA